MIKISKNIQEIPHSPTLLANDLVHEKRAKNEHVCHMGFGESPFPVPERLQNALADAAHRKDYLKADGLDELREAVKDYYRPIYGDEYVDGCDVMIAPGSKLILYGLQMAVEGDLLMPVPSWVSYEPQSTMLGTQTIKVPSVLDDHGYHIDPDILRDTIKHARAQGHNPSKIILNAPSNPTGLSMTEEMMESLTKICRDENILIISDEIYGLLSFDSEYRTPVRYAPDGVAVTTGLSKHLSLGGWRIGVGFTPKALDGLHHAMRCIASETWSCVASPIQVAAIEAYKHHPDIEDHIAACTAIHGFINNYICERFRALGVTAPNVQGSFYNYPDFSAYRDALAEHGIATSDQLHKVLLKDYNIATLPAVSFGAAPEVLALRISGCDYDGAKALQAYQNGTALDQSFIETYTPNVKEGMDLFEKFLQDKAATILYARRTA